MNKKGYSVRFFAIAILFFLIFATAVEAFTTQLFDRFFSRVENPEIVDSTEQIIRLDH